MPQEKIGRKARRAAHGQAAREPNPEDELGRLGGHARGDQLGNLLPRESLPSIAPPPAIPPSAPTPTARSKRLGT